MQSRDHSYDDQDTHEANQSAQPHTTVRERIVASHTHAHAHDVALEPVERAAAQSVPPRGRKAWLGWAAASVLLVGGGTQYFLGYRPLEAQRDRADVARVQRLQAHQAQLSSLRSELDRTRAELEQANVEAAALKAAQVQAVAAAEAPAIEPAEASEAPTKKKAVRRSARRARQSASDESSAKKRGASSRTKPQASKNAEPSQPLRGVLSTSNDPLEGL